MFEELKTAAIRQNDRHDRVYITRVFTHNHSFVNCKFLLHENGVAD